jgi:hypothetical protein
LSMCLDEQTSFLPVACIMSLTDSACL